MSKNKLDSLSQEIISYNQTFERWLKTHYLTYDLFVKDRRYAKFKDDALFLHSLRNLAAHDSLQYVEVFDTALERIDNFVSTVTAETLSRTMNPIQKLKTAKLYEKVIPHLKELKAKNYSYLPIISDRKVCQYIFSSYILMEYMCLGLKIDENTTFDNLYHSLQKEDLNLCNPAVCLPLQSSIFDVIEALKVTSDFHHDVVLVTDDGDEDSPLLGMITIWDLQ